MPTATRRHVPSFVALTLAFALLCPPSGYTRQGFHPQEPPRAMAGGKDERKEKPDPCQQALKAEGEAEGLHRRCEDAASSNGVAKGDFNGDGFADLAVGVPYEDITVNGGERTDAGSVNIIYGSASGLSAGGPVPAQSFSQTTTGVSGVSEDGDNFGKSLASGDFNGDGFSDLAVGIPNEDLTVVHPLLTREVRDAGAVVIIYGSPNGLDPTGEIDAQFVSGLTFFTVSYRCFDGDSLCFNMLDIHDYDRFGSSLAWGDFNDDGKGDLAVGAPKQDYLFRTRNSDGDMLRFAGTEVTDAGAVFVFRGRSSGLDDWQLFFAPENVGGSENDGDNFGAALAGGNFDSLDGDDLAIGIPGDQPGPPGDPSDLTDEGSILVLFGRSCGGASRLQRSCAPPQRLNGGQANLRLGSVLAAGDFRGVGGDDLAAGVPRRQVANHFLGLQNEAGSVFIYRRNQDGQMIRAQTINQSLQTPLAGGPEAGDRFGSALAVGDFDGDGLKDLAIGAPFEDITTNGITFLDIGGAQVNYGHPTALHTSSRVFVLNTLAREPQSDANYGFALTAWDFGLNPGTTLRPTADLAVGVPGKNIGTVRGAGEVVVIYGSADGSFDNRTDHWNQASAGVPGAAEAGDRFGSAIY